MAFDLSTARPVGKRFDLSTARQVENVSRETPQPDSIATQGLGYVKEHPFKTLFDPALKTLTGKGISERVDENIGMKPYEVASKFGNNPIINAMAITQGTTMGVAADLADMATAPINAVGGLVTKIPGVKQAGQAIAKSKIGQSVGNFLNQERHLFGDKAIEDKVFNLYNKTVGGTKIRNLSETNKIKTERLTAIKTIQENADNLKFPDENTGEMVSRIPSNRFEQVQALRQTKQSVWNEVQKMSKGATEKGAQINLNVVVNDALDDTIKSIGQDAIEANPRLLNSIREESSNVRRIGSTTPTRAEEFMKSLNKELQSFRNSGQAVDYSVIDFKSNLIHRLNQATDDAVEKALSRSGYSAQRAKYAALKSAEKEMIGAANKFLKQEAGAGGVVHPVVDFWSLEELMYGGGKMLLGDVKGGANTIGRGIGLQLVKKVNDYFKSPDRAMKQMYELAGKYKNPIIPGSKPVAVEAELMGKNIPTDMPIGIGMDKPKGIGFQKSIKRTDRILPTPKQAGQSSGPTIPLKTSPENYGKTEDPYGFLADAKKNIGKGLAVGVGATVLGSKRSEAENIDNKMDFNRAKKMIAKLENYGKTEGNWLQIEDSVIKDLVKRKKIPEGTTYSDVLKDSKLYDDVAKAYLYDLRDTHGLKTIEDAAIWLYRPAYFKKYGKTGAIPLNKKGSFKKTAREVMQGREQKIKKFLSDEK